MKYLILLLLSSQALAGDIYLNCFDGNGELLVNEPIYEGETTIAYGVNIKLNTTNGYTVIDARDNTFDVRLHDTLVIVTNDGDIQCEINE